MTLSTAGSIPLETSDTDSISVGKRRHLVITGRADEPPTSLSRSLDNQAVLYPLGDSIKCDIFQAWWDLTPYGVQLPISKRPRWGKQSTHQNSVWPYFTEGADIMQGEPKAICKLCGKVIVHPTPKNSGTRAFWNHLNSDRCQDEGERPPLLQQLLVRHFGKVSFYHTDLSHLLMILRAM